MIWLLALFIFSLFIGATPVDVMAGVVSLFSLYHIWSRKVQGHRHWLVIYWTQFDWIFAFWLVAGIIGLLVHYGLDLSGLQKILDYRWILFFYLLSFAMIRSRISEECLSWVAGFGIVVALYSVIIGVWGFDPIAGKELMGIGSSGLYVNGGFFSDASILAQCYGVILFWFLGPIFYYARFREPKIWWLILATVALGFALFLSQEVWVWLASLVALAVVSLSFNFRIGVLVLVVFGILAAVLLAFFPGALSSIGFVIEFSRLPEVVLAFKSQMTTILEHPFIGSGHEISGQNQYLLFFYESGVMVGLSYIVTLLLFLMLTIKTWREVPDKDLFHKGLALGLMGSQIVFIIGGFIVCIFEAWMAKYTIITVWALVTWLAYEYRVLRERV